MKKYTLLLLRNLKFATLLLVFSIFFMPCANAQVLSEAKLIDVVNAINRFHDTMKESIANFWRLTDALIFEQNPNQAPTIQANAGANSGVTNVMNTSEVATLAAVQQALTTQDENEIQALGSMETSNTYYSPASGLNLTGNQNRQKGEIQSSILRGDKALSLDTLLSPMAYPGFDFKNLNKNPSYNFIRLASGFYDPVGLNIVKQFNTLNDTQKKEMQTSTDYQKYQATLRAYIATQSVGVSNLYQMMAERIPQPGLGKEVGMPNANASALQVQQYLATRRSQNKDWYQQMAKASPVTIQREALFTMAEIRQQLFTLQLQNERLLATLSIMALQGQQMSKASLQLLGQKVQTQIDNAKGVNTSQTPTLPSIPH